MGEMRSNDAEKLHYDMTYRKVQVCKKIMADETKYI